MRRGDKITEKAIGVVAKIERFVGNVGKLRTNDTSGVVAVASFEVNYSIDITTG